MATIAIDGRALVGPRAGIGWHTFHLIEELAKARSRHRFVVFAHRPVADPPGYGAPNVTWRFGTGGPGLVWQQARLPRLLAAERVDLFHSTIGTFPLWLRLPAVATLHDVTTHTHASAHTWKSRLATGTLLRRSLRKARRVIAVSEATKQDAVTHFGIAREKIVVVWNGVSAVFRPVPGKAALAAMRDRVSAGRPYFLTVGTVEPRKNLVRLLEAYARFSASRPGGPALVLAGGKGWGERPVLEAVRRLRLSDRVRFCDYVTQGELPLLYSAALALAYPSLHEGFGLPVIEAFACGTPVLTSNLSALPEVAGGAALLVDPHSIASIQQGLERLAGNEPLRRRLARLGVARAKRFRWSEAARRTLDVYETVLAA